jgi:hypothetical protein
MTGRKLITWTKFFTAALARTGKPDADPSTHARNAASTADYAAQENEERKRQTRLRARLRKDSAE